MAKARRKDPSEQLLTAVIRGIQEVKGKEIVHLDLRGLANTACDHFVVCHGDSATQVDAIARSVEKLTREQANEKPWHAEGNDNAGWILLDYVDVVVHIFHRDRRKFYDLELLWADAIRNTYENVA